MEHDAKRGSKVIEVRLRVPVKAYVVCDRRRIYLIRSVDEDHSVERQ